MERIRPGRGAGRHRRGRAAGRLDRLPHDLRQGCAAGLHAVSALLGLVGALALGIGLVNCLQVVTTFGLAVGIAGIVLLLLSLLVWRKAAGKQAIPFNGRKLLAYAIGIVGALVLGVGMCLTMVWGTSYLIPGILVGCAGLLICVLNAALRLVKAA